MGSKIEWTTDTWNPLAGCSPVSEGCKFCYAARDALRLAGNPNEKVKAAYEGTSEMRGIGENRRPVFTGRINLLPERLDQPIRWKRARRIFVNSMSDLFHESVPFDYVDRVFAVMALCPQHQFQVLTKRPERMAQYMRGNIVETRYDSILSRAEQAHDMVWDSRGQERHLYSGRMTKERLAKRRVYPGWPLPNVWLGTSTEDQATLEERLPHLLDTPAAVRFLSCEPLLGGLDLGLAMRNRSTNERLHWVIVGGESGPKARPMNPHWVRVIKEDCQRNRIPFFFKQWGAWGPWDDPLVAAESTLRGHSWPGGEWVFRRGKKVTGRMLDRREYNEYPKELEAVT